MQDHYRDRRKFIAEAAVRLEMPYLELLKMYDWQIADMLESEATKQRDKIVAAGFEIQNGIAERLNVVIKALNNVTETISRCMRAR